MAEPLTHINYSFEDIQRYLQGKMSAAEMHAVEKAALQDSFLADAIEGYREVSSTTAQQHLNEINAALQTEQQEFKVISINKNLRWLRIAAIIIVLAGVGVIGSYFFKTANKTQNVAMVKNKELNKTNIKQDSVATITPETTSINKNIAAAITKNSNQQNARSFKTEKRTESKTYADTITDNQADNVSIAAAPVAQNNKAAKSFAPSSNQNNDSQLNDLQDKVSGLSITANTFAGKVVDENNKPVAGVVIEPNDKQRGVVTDLNGNFVLQKSDSILNVTATTVGYENKNTMLKPNESNLITLKESTLALNDVVVTGYGGKKNKTANRAEQQTPAPIGGWTNFNNYVMSKLNEDSTGRENYITNNDVVELEFLIDDEGNPYNIHITKPLDEQRNSKAIDILKSGPKWTNTSKKKKAKVAIAF